jgi:hypothetical protein
MESINIIEFLPVVLGQVQACPAPNPIQMALIVALVAAIGIVGVGASVVAITSVATIIVQQILAGASIVAIAAAIEVDVQTTGVSLGILAALVASIQNILGCQ